MRDISVYRRLQLGSFGSTARGGLSSGARPLGCAARLLQPVVGTPAGVPGTGRDPPGTGRRLRAGPSRVTPAGCAAMGTPRGVSIPRSRSTTSFELTTVGNANCAERPGPDPFRDAALMPPAPWLPEAASSPGSTRPAGSNSRCLGTPARGPRGILAPCRGRVGRQRQRVRGGVLQQPRPGIRSRAHPSEGDELGTPQVALPLTR